MALSSNPPEGFSTITWINLEELLRSPSSDQMGGRYSDGTDAQFASDKWNSLSLSNRHNAHRKQSVPFSDRERKKLEWSKNATSEYVTAPQNRHQTKKKTDADDDNETESQEKNAEEENEEGDTLTAEDRGEAWHIELRPIGYSSMRKKLKESITGESDTGEKSAGDKRHLKVTHPARLPMRVFMRAILSRLGVEPKSEAMRTKNTVVKLEYYFCWHSSMGKAMKPNERINRVLHPPTQRGSKDSPVLIYIGGKEIDDEGAAKKGKKSAKKK